MVQQINGKEIKEKILKYLLEKGPELPVHIAKHLSMNSIFASAFLSEMASEGMIKISDMKVGGSPIYYEPSTKPLLEKYFNYLGGKDKEACLLLKEKGILEDSSQPPVIRVALRGLKDFAFPFKNDDKSFWRYFLVSEEEVKKRLEETPKITEVKKVSEEIVEKKLPSEEKQIIEQKAEKIIQQEDKKTLELEKINEELEKKKTELEELTKELESKSKEKSQIKPKKEKISKKLRPIRKEKPMDETFLNEIKQILEKKQIELIKIESFDKKQVLALIKTNGQEKLVAAFNKKKLENDEMIKISKIASAKNIQYIIMLKGEISKKTSETIEAHKRLSSIERIG